MCSVYHWLVCTQTLSKRAFRNLNQLIYRHSKHESWPVWMNAWGFRPFWAKWTSRGWWDQSDNTALLKQVSKFEHYGIIWWIINKQCSFSFRMFICTFENIRKNNAIDFSESGRAMFTPPNLKDVYTSGCSYRQLKHNTTLFSLSDHYILSREWRVIVDQLQTNYHGRPMVYNQSGVTELLIMRDPHYGRMCFASVL